MMRFQSFRSLLLAGLVLSAPAAQAYNMIQTTSTGRVTSGNMVSCTDSGGFAHWGPAVYANIEWRLNTSGQGAGKQTASQNAMAAWNQVSAADHFLNYVGTTSAGWSTDGTNSIVFATGNGCTGTCLGLTALVMQSGQVIVESDITMNASYTWSTNGTGWDTQSVLTHELGHSLGIHHSTAAGNPTMRSGYSSGDLSPRTLESDDRSALQCSQSRYGVRPVRVTVSGPSSRSPRQLGTWTCDVSGGLPPYTRVWFKTSQSGVTDLGNAYTQSTSDRHSFNIVCDVLDSSGRFGSDYMFVDVDGDPGFPPLPY